VQSIQAAITINRPIGEVWDFVSDIRNQVQWFAGMRAVRAVSAVERGTGAELEVDVQLFGWRFTSRMKVTDFVPPGRMTMLSARSPINFSAAYRLEPANDGFGTTFMLEAIVIAGSIFRLFGPAFGPMLRAAVRRRFIALKQLLESTPGRLQT
jgi:uncharacterized protein YndB with AHSA1/START domain